MIDYYAILGIPPTATAEDVKAAYRRLVKQWHPDVCGLPNAHQEFVRITEAYSVLSDPYQRAQYDRVYQQHFQRHQEGARPDTQSASNAWKEFLRQSADFRRAAAEQARRYWNMNLDRVLSVLSQSAAQAAGYVWRGERDEVDSRWTFADTLATGFKGLLLLISIVMVFSGALTVPGGFLAFLAWRSLMKDDRFIGFGKLFSSMLVIVVILLAGWLVLGVLVTQGILR